MWHLQHDTTSKILERIANRLLHVDSFVLIDDDEEPIMNM